MSLSDTAPRAKSNIPKLSLVLEKHKERGTEEQGDKITQKRKRTDEDGDTAKKKRKKRIKPFRLLDLPPELWSKIGKLVIDGADRCTKDGIILTCRIRKHLPLGHVKAERPAITRTCLALRDELLPYFYRTKVNISINWRNTNKGIIGRWLESIDGLRRSSVAGLSVEMMDSHLKWEEDRQGRVRIKLLTSDIREHWNVKLKVELQAVEEHGARFSVMLL